MGSTCVYFFCAHILDGICRIGDGSCGIDHIIENDAVLALDISDDVHDLALVRLRSSLVHDSNRAVHALCHVSCSRYASVVRRYNDNVFHLLLNEVFRQSRQSNHVIYRNVEISLNLVCVKIHGDYPIHTGCYQQVCHQLCRNRISGLCLSVLTSITVIRNYRIDAACRCSLHGIYHNQEFHQIVVYRISGGLNDEYILVTNGLPDADRNLTVAELANGCLSQFYAHQICNFLCQLRMRVACEKFHVGKSLCFHVYIPPKHILEIKN